MLIAAFFLALFTGTHEVVAQAADSMWTFVKTINVGAQVSAVKLIKGPNGSPQIMIGVQGDNNGWVEVRDLNSGKVTNRINAWARVYTLDTDEGDSLVVIGTIYGANAYNLRTQKKTILADKSSGALNEVKWASTDSGQVLITADQSGWIEFYKYDGTKDIIQAFKAINTPKNSKVTANNPSAFSIDYWNGNFFGGFLNQYAQWNTQNWAMTEQVYMAPSASGGGRGVLIKSVANRLFNDFVVTVDGDSLTAFDLNGNRLYAIPMIDRPTEITFGAFTFPYVAISTEWDRCLLYDISTNPAQLISNFSKHSSTVSSVDIKSFGGNDVFMVTGSVDNTVEVWRYNQAYKR